MMKKLVLLAVVSLFATGCSMKNPVLMEGLPSGDNRYVIDNTKEDDYPGFWTGEGNIYTCRYGIHFQSQDEFSPPKAEMFGALLKEQFPNIIHNQVALDRFDVYVNTRLLNLRGAGAGIGGAIGGMIAGGAMALEEGFTDKLLRVERVPEEYPFETDENAVGCDGKMEGEYYSSRVTGGHSVVVTWLQFSINGEGYHFRSEYQFPSSEIREKEVAVEAAIRKTIKAVSSMLSVQRS